MNKTEQKKPSMMKMVNSSQAKKIIFFYIITVGILKLSMIVRFRYGEEALI
jgi:hypothetical protein